MDHNPPRNRLLPEDRAGIGQVTSAKVHLRVHELTANAEHDAPPPSQADYEQAKRELALVAEGAGPARKLHAAEATEPAEGHQS